MRLSDAEIDAVINSMQLVIGCKLMKCCTLNPFDIDRFIETTYYVDDYYVDDEVYADYDYYQETEELLNADLL